MARPYTVTYWHYCQWAKLARTRRLHERLQERERWTALEPEVVERIVEVPRIQVVEKIVELEEVVEKIVEVPQRVD